MHALVQNPEAAAKSRPTVLLPSAVDEIIRWVTPVKEFMRTATRDYDIGGTTIKEGEQLLRSTRRAKPRRDRVRPARRVST